MLRSIGGTKGMNAADIGTFIEENCPELGVAERKNFSSWLKDLVDGVPISSNSSFRACRSPLVCRCSAMNRRISRPSA